MSVILRIYYKIGLHPSTMMTLDQFRKTNFVEVLRSLETEEDINLVHQPIPLLSHFLFLNSANVVPRVLFLQALLCALLSVFGAGQGS